METKQIFSTNFRFELNSFLRLLKYSLKTTLASIRIYFYCFLLPIIFYSVIYLIVTSFGYAKVTSLNQVSTLASLLLAACFALMSAACLINNWKYSVMIKQFKIFRISKQNLIFSLLLTTIVITLLSYLTLIIWGCFLDLFLINQNFINSLKIITSFSQVLGIFFGLILAAFITFSIAYLLSFLISSPLLIQTLNVVIIVFILLSSNVVGLNLITNNQVNAVLNILGYFNPLKAVQWIFFASYANLISNLVNARQIVASAYGDFSFTLYRNDVGLILPLAISTAFFWAGALFLTTFFVKIKK
ncbi:hypothetical protein SCLARK_00914 [Spiroplasma clarkii]|uniref:Uncharacterized protein n=1 Tax=Spiroplasma clarkii TaxID=2139 RepID=A0A1Y0L0H6_9MOLU|nr:hypothetical protein [Spiroplasma clarkii]ARU91522.1 hypothetical protein SCLARK_00914 [Spiroplasma clarkii]ATX70932.1 hypothetical protein SCLAR_v1c06130 [Spiroplasma clarkii]